MSRGARSLLALTLIGCAPEAPRVEPAQMSEAALTAELARCRGLGLAVYEDATCRAAQAERTARFYRRPSGDTP